jgi:hypothetical protein
MAGCVIVDWQWGGKDLNGSNEEVAGVQLGELGEMGEEAGEGEKKELTEQ